jgi:hypothetical protein
MKLSDDLRRFDRAAVDFLSRIVITEAPVDPWWT